ncbi:MAG: hypothetical protein QG567_1329, partial [Campylobacterota bacterium]|nr:hypothetical protein [Campylobacterota bacterium]
MMSKISIKTKLLGITIIVALISFSLIVQTFYSKMSEKNMLQKVDTLVDLSVVISKFVHETQKERGMSAGYIGSNGQNFANNLPTQRESTDKVVAEFKKITSVIDFSNFSPELKQEVEEINSILESLQEKREQVSSLKMTVAENLKYYTDLNSKLLDIVPLAGKISDDENLAKALIAYSSFLYSKERAGLERAVFSVAFGKKEMDKALLKKAVTLIAEQDSYMHSFLSVAHEDVKSYYHEKMQSQSVKEVADLREKAFADEFSTDATYWFGVMTKKIDILKEIDDYISSSTKKAISNGMDSANSSMISSIATVSISAFVIILVIFFVSQSISKGVFNAKDQIQKIALSHDLSKNIECYSGGELAEISYAVNSLIESFRNMLDETKKSAAESAESSVSLKNTAENLSSNIDIQQNSIENINKLVGDVSKELDLTEEVVITTTKDLEDTKVVLDGFVGDLSEVVKLITNGSSKQEEISHKMNNLTSQAAEIKSVLSIIGDIADQT